MADSKTKEKALADGIKVLEYYYKFHSAECNTFQIKLRQDNIKYLKELLADTKHINTFGGHDELIKQASQVQIKLFE